MKRGTRLRKMLSAMLCAAMTLGLFGQAPRFSQPVSAQEAESNRAPNPSFEQELSGDDWLAWVDDSLGAFERTNEQKSDGDYSLKIQG